MTLFLSEIEFEQLFESSSKEQNSSQAGPVEINVNDPKQLSQGFRRYIDLCPGLDLQIDDYELHEDLVIECSPFDPWSFLEFSFSILGDNRIEKIPKGQNFLFAVVEGGGDRRYHKFPAGERILKFDIHMNFSFFQTLVGNQFEQLPPELRQVLTGINEQEYYQFGKTTPAMQIILHQILNCPYQGAIRNLYLEGKVLELIALRLQYAFEDNFNLQPSVSLRADQVDCIYYARDLLLTHLDNPPSVMELARQVGINHNKLRQGFRQIFGTTVFGYRHNWRMEKAQQLLCEGKMSVAAVANTVGYANPAQFAGAFKRKFGITPRACRLG